MDHLAKSKKSKWRRSWKQVFGRSSFKDFACYDDDATNIVVTLHFW